MIHIHKIINNRCTLELQLGRKYLVHNMNVDHVEGFVNQTLKSRLLHLLQWCQYQIDHCPNKLSRVGAVHALLYRLSGIENWDYQKTLLQLAQIESLILLALPTPKAAHYRHVSQLAFDLILFGKQKSEVV